MAIFNHNKYISVQSIILTSIIFQICILCSPINVLLTFDTIKYGHFYSVKVALKGLSFLLQKIVLCFKPCNEWSCIVLHCNNGIGIHVNG